MDSNLLARIANPEVDNPLADRLQGAQTGNALMQFSNARQSNALAPAAAQGDQNALNALAGVDPQKAQQLGQVQSQQRSALLTQGLQAMMQADNPQAWEQFRQAGIAKTGQDIGGFETRQQHINTTIGMLDPQAYAQRQFQTQMLDKPQIEHTVDPLTGETNFYGVRPMSGTVNALRPGGGQGAGGQSMQAPAGQTPQAAPMPMASTGNPDQDAMLARLPAPAAQTVKGLISYDVDPNKLPIKARAGLLAAAQQIDPTYSAANYPARAAMIKDATSGKMASANNSLNTGIGHLDQLVDAVGKLNNGDFTPKNAVVNGVKTVMGDPSVTNFKAVADRVAPEITRIWRGVGGSEADIARDLATLSSASSPQQLYGAIGNIAKMMQSKIDSNQFQYEQTVPGRPITMIRPEAEAVISKLEQLASNPRQAKPNAAPGGDQVQAGSKGNPITVDNEDYARKLPSGTFFKLGGQTYRVN